MYIHRDDIKPSALPSTHSAQPSPTAPPRVMTWALTHSRLVYWFLPFIVFVLYYGSGFAFSRLTQLSPIHATVIWDSVLIVVCLVCLWVWRRNAPRWGYVAAPRAAVRLSVWTLALVLLFVWYVGQLWAGYTYAHFPHQDFDTYSSNFTGNLVEVLLLTLVIAPIAEELLVRRILYGFWSRYFPLFALFFQAAVFVMIHGTATHIIPTFLFALLAAAVYEAKGLVWSIGLHMLYNLYSTVLVGVPVPHLVTVANFLVPAGLVLIYLLWSLWTVSRYGQVVVMQQNCNHAETLMNTTVRWSSTPTGTWNKYWYAVPRLLARHLLVTQSAR